VKHAKQSNEYWDKICITVCEKQSNKGCDKTIELINYTKNKTIKSGV